MRDRLYILYHYLLILENSLDFPCEQAKFDKSWTMHLDVTAVKTDKLLSVELKIGPYYT